MSTRSAMFWNRIYLALLLSLIIGSRSRAEGIHAGFDVPSAQLTSVRDPSGRRYLADSAGNAPGAADECGNFIARPQEAPNSCWAAASTVVRDFYRKSPPTDERALASLTRNSERKRQVTGGKLFDVARILRRQGFGVRPSSLARLKPGEAAVVGVKIAGGGGHYIAVCKKRDGNLLVADSDPPGRPGDSTLKTLPVNGISDGTRKVVSVQLVSKRKGLFGFGGFLGIF